MTETTDTAAPAADETLLPQEGDQTDAQTPETGEGQNSGDDAAAATEQPEGDKPRRQSAQERIDELTKARREAERDREYWREQALASQRQPEPQPVQHQEDAEPDPAQFPYGDSDPGYVRAVAKWEIRQELAAERERMAQERQVEQTRTAFQQREAAYRASAPDYEDAVYNNRWPVQPTPAMSEAIADSPDGPAVAYFLAKNPAEVRRIAGLPPVAQIRELGRIEAALIKPAAQPANTVSNAPPPPPQARGVAGKFKPAADTDDFAAFEKAYP
jgi:hypothetical protein